MSFGNRIHSELFYISIILHWDLVNSIFSYPSVTTGVKSESCTGYRISPTRFVVLSYFIIIWSNCFYLFTEFIPFVRFGILTSVGLGMSSMRWQNSSLLMMLMKMISKKFIWEMPIICCSKHLCGIISLLSELLSQ